MIKKLANRKGETLVESLASIVIVLLASILLVTVVTVSVSIVKKSRQKLLDNNVMINNAEAAVAPEATGSLTITCGTDTYTVEVNIYGNAEKGITAYKVVE